MESTVTHQLKELGILDERESQKADVMATGTYAIVDGDADEEYTIVREGD